MLMRYVMILGATAMLGAGSVSLAKPHDGSPEQSVPETVGLGEMQGGGIELGEYEIRSYYTVEAQKSIVHFVLFATAGSEHLAEARQIAKQREHKIRDQVIIATRMMPLGQFDEPDLKSFRRRILLRLRRAMPELLFDDVYVSDFELKVQNL